MRGSLMTCCVTSRVRSRDLRRRQHAVVTSEATRVKRVISEKNRADSTSLVTVQFSPVDDSRYRFNDDQKSRLDALLGMLIRPEVGSNEAGTRPQTVCRSIREQLVLWRANYQELEASVTSAGANGVRRTTSAAGDDFCTQQTDSSIRPRPPGSQLASCC